MISGDPALAGVWEQQAWRPEARCGEWAMNVHPPAFHLKKDRRLQVAEFYSGPRLGNPAASVD